MPELIYGHDQFVTEWVAYRLEMSLSGVAIGIAENGVLIAGVVYSDYRADVPSMEASIASEHPKWATRRTLKALFDYPFTQIGVNRLQATTLRKNKRARRFLIRLGFQLEGIAHEAYPQRRDAAVYAMFARNCKWI